MIELLILYELSNKVLTMYGISKEIRLFFSVLTTPSYGTIKPALYRLEKSGFVKTRKSMTKGGRSSTFYSITEDVEFELKRLLTSPPQDNPIQFLTTSRIKLVCADVLSQQEQLMLLTSLKVKAEHLMIETENILKNRNPDFYSRMVFDNLICEYKNFISLVQGFETALKMQSK